jgi:hypothetical protein
MIDTELLEQRSLEWRMARVGSVTASRVYDVICRNKPKNGQKLGDYSAKRVNYMDEIVSERITGQPSDWKEIRSLNDRAALEPDARACYSFYTGREIDLIGFVRHPSIPWVGASPDGIVGKAGMVEIKCLDAKNHLKLFTERWEDVVAEYLPQVQLGLLCTQRKWCDFVVFNPTMPEDLKLFTLRLKPDEPEMGRIEQEIELFLAEVDARVEAIRTKARR